MGSHLGGRIVPLSPESVMPCLARRAALAARAGPAVSDFLAALAGFSTIAFGVKTSSGILALIVSRFGVCSSTGPIQVQ